VGYDDGKKELGNSLNCKSYSLNPRRLSLNWEKRKEATTAILRPTRCCQRLVGTNLKAAQNVGFTDTTESMALSPSLWNYVMV